MQYTKIFYEAKLKMSLEKKSIIFFLNIFVQNIHCGYTLEPHNGKGGGGGSMVTLSLG